MYEPPLPWERNTLCAKLFGFSEIRELVMMIVVTFLAHLSEQITEAYIALANYGKK